MKIAPIALADVTARLVAYAAFQNKYIYYYIMKYKKIMSNIVGVDVLGDPE